MGGFPDDQAVIIDLLPATLQNPIALFEYAITDLTVSFIDLSEVVNEYALDSWQWGFGDGNFSSRHKGAFWFQKDWKSATFTPKSEALARLSSYNFLIHSTSFRPSVKS